MQALVPHLFLEWEEAEDQSQNYRPQEAHSFCPRLWEEVRGGACRLGTWERHLCAEAEPNQPSTEKHPPTLQGCVAFPDMECRVDANLLVRARLCTLQKLERQYPGRSSRMSNVTHYPKLHACASAEVVALLKEPLLFAWLVPAYKVGSFSLGRSRLALPSQENAPSHVHGACEATLG